MTEEHPMDSGIRALESTTARLIDAVTDMSKRLNTTERISRQLQRQQEELAREQAATTRQGRINAWLALSIALDIALSLIIGLGFFRIDSNADRIDHIQDRTSNEVLCPLYGIFLASIENPRPEQVDTPEERARFEAAAKTIRDGYSALECHR